MYRKLKTLLLVILIVMCTLINDYSKCYAVGTGVAVASGSAWESIVGSSVAYAGYKATKKQVKEISNVIGGMVGDFVTKSESAIFPENVSKSDFMSWVESTWQDNKYYQAYKAWSDALWEEKMKKYCTGTSAEQLDDVLEDVKSSYQVIQGGKNDDDDKWNFAGTLYVIGAAAGVQVSVSAGFELALSKAAKAVIDLDYNAEYEKSKSKYDWEALGFKADYNTFPQKNYDYFKACFSTCTQFSTYYEQMWNVSNKTIMVYTPPSSEYMVYSYGFPVFSDGSVLAMVTLRDYKTEKWITYCTKEEFLFNLFTQYKNDVISYEDFFNQISNIENYGIDLYALKDATSTSPFFTVNLLGNIFSGEQTSSPFGIKVAAGGNMSVPSSSMSLDSANCTIINSGKTMNYFYINFADETTYSASCSALSGEIEPVVKKSQYTNTAEEIDSAGEITIDTDKANAADNTDELMEQIAKQNDLSLDTNKHLEEEVETSKGILSTVKNIWETLKSVPSKIYDAFSSILNRILNAIKANPLKLYNYIKSPLTSLQSDVNSILQNLPETIAAEVPGLQNIENLLTLFKGNLDTDMLSLLDIKTYSLPNVLSAIQTLAGETTLGNIVTAINELPVMDVLRAIENLPGMLTYGNIVTAIDGLPVPDILTAIQNLPDTLSLGNIQTSIESIPDAVGVVVSGLFIPGDDYFPGKTDEINIKLKNKLPFEKYNDYMDGIQEIEPERIPNVTITMYGKTVILINMDLYYSVKPEMDPYIKGVFFFLMLMFNIHHLYFLVRGEKLESSGSGVGTDEGCKLGD